MTRTAVAPPRPDVGGVAQVALASAASTPANDVVRRLGTSVAGLSDAEASRRASEFGPNAVRSHHVRWLDVLGRQLRSPLLGLLAGTATASFFVGERTDAVIIGAILVLSVGLGFTNEFRAERAAAALHDEIRHTVVVIRGGRACEVDVTALVPGDVIDLEAGSVVAADARLLSAVGLECDEAVVTGESLPAAKSPEPVQPGSDIAGLSSCALMGTVVRSGTARAVVVATGASAVFGRAALALGERLPETEFQVGLRRFSMLLVRVAATLSVAVFATNVALHRPVLDALLFALAIAVGITPQLLPAVVSTSLAAGSRALAQRKVLVKRLVCIEDLGNMRVLCTDKTGTLTQGRLSFMRAVGVGGHPDADVVRYGLLCGEASGAATTGAHLLDAALATSPAASRLGDELAAWHVDATMPFDHTRRLMSVVVSDRHGRSILLTKGAPESLLARCRNVDAGARAALEAEFAAGGRVVAVGMRAWAGGSRALTPDDERDFELVGLLVFLDAPKTSAPHALQRLTRLGIDVRVITGDNDAVATKVCRDIGLAVHGVMRGAEIEVLDDQALRRKVVHTTVFARVDPEQKARIVRALRAAGSDVAFLGDGVNDAVALHAADVGIAVDDGADVAKDAADIILLEKDLDVLADGVITGRRTFANTLKYLLMGTSSNFGNMLSAAGASAVLSFLPMLPSQVLLNNLLYDTSQLAIPTDEVDDEQLARPAHWDLRMLRKYMLYFGPISSAFDFATFAVLLWVLDAGPAMFRTGWFIESLATQTLVIFVIRTRRPFLRSRPSAPLLAAALGAVALGVITPATPLSHDLGFVHPTARLLWVVAGMVVAYLVLVELVKQWFFRVVAPDALGGRPTRPSSRDRRVHRRAARFTSRTPIPRRQRRTTKSAG